MAFNETEESELKMYDYKSRYDRYLASGLGIYDQSTHAFLVGVLQHARALVWVGF